MKFTISQLIEQVNNSVENADKEISKLNSDIINMEGMSGKKTRHLYNNICSLTDANYLEVGTWKGSSFISALYKNDTLNPIAIDNWSEFDGPKQEFIDNVNRMTHTVNNNTMRPIPRKFDFIEKDSFQVEDSDIRNIYDSVDIYLYDGDHSKIAHTKAITHYYKFLSKYSIVMIDDWRNDIGGCEGIHRVWKNVIDGTFDGLISSPIMVHHKVERFSVQEDYGNQNYWNGVLILVCERLDI
jgi:hypothetical protein